LAHHREKIRRKSKCLVELKKERPVKLKFRKTVFDSEKDLEKKQGELEREIASGERTVAYWTKVKKEITAALDATSKSRDALNTGISTILGDFDEIEEFMALEEFAAAEAAAEAEAKLLKLEAKGEKG
jgi:hypothetical protein